MKYNAEELPPIIYTEDANYWLRIERDEYNNLWEFKYLNDGLDKVFLFKRKKTFEQSLIAMMEELELLKSDGGISFQIQEVLQCLLRVYWKVFQLS